MGERLRGVDRPRPLPCAAIDWLVLVVDRSKSIDERELTLQRNAYVRLLSDASVISALDGAHVAIVEFDTRSEIVVDWTDPETAARLYRHKRPDGLRGQTGIGGALTTALALLVGKSGRLVVDISGDGKENVDTALLSAMRAAAGERSVEINGLAIMTPDTPEIDRYYSQQVVNGFVLPVEKPTISRARSSASCSTRSPALIARRARSIWQRRAPDPGRMRPPASERLFAGRSRLDAEPLRRGGTHRRPQPARAEIEVVGRVGMRHPWAARLLAGRLSSGGALV